MQFCLLVAHWMKNQAASLFRLRALIDIPLVNMQVCRPPGPAGSSV